MANSPSPRRGEGQGEGWLHVSEPTPSSALRAPSPRGEKDRLLLYTSHSGRKNTAYDRR
jgi:hypothetical protein